MLTVGPHREQRLDRHVAEIGGVDHAVLLAAGDRAGERQQIAGERTGVVVLGVGEIERAARRVLGREGEAGPFANIGVRCRTEQRPDDASAGRLDRRRERLPRGGPEVAPGVPASGRRPLRGGRPLHRAARHEQRRDGEGDDDEELRALLQETSSRAPGAREKVGGPTNLVNLSRAGRDTRSL